MDQLMQKLMLSKAIMDKTDGIGRNNQATQINNPSVENFTSLPARYNIPNEIMEQTIVNQERKQTVQKTPTVDAIKNSRLPDEIKQLMIEHPIVQPQQHQATLSDDVIEKASKLMKERSNNYVPSSAQSKETHSTSSQIDYNIIRKMIKESVEDVLRENGVISESSEKSNEFFSFKVGKHIFEGKVTKIKKTQ